MNNFDDPIFKESIFGGEFQICHRDVSYWNDENGTNREDRYMMKFKKENHIYKIGSHPTFTGALKWFDNRKNDEQRFMESVR